MGFTPKNMYRLFLCISNTDLGNAASTKKGDQGNMKQNLRERTKSNAQISMRMITIRGKAEIETSF